MTRNLGDFAGDVTAAIDVGADGVPSVARIGCGAR